MALPNNTTQDAATYKANIDATAADHETRIAANASGVAANASALAALKIVQANQAIIEIGDWDMVALGAVVVGLGGINDKRVISVSAIIRNDDDSQRYVFLNAHESGTIPYGISINSNDSVSLYRDDGGFFNSSIFNSTGYNRGWVLVQYVDANL